MSDKLHLTAVIHGVASEYENDTRRESLETLGNAHSLCPDTVLTSSRLASHSLASQIMVGTGRVSVQSNMVLSESFVSLRFLLPKGDPLGDNFIEL